MSGQAPRLLAEGSRVEAFSDGVLAIAITLLVLDLHAGDKPRYVGHDLLAQWPTYLAYVASFLYIGVIWVNHHSLFTRIANVDAGLLWCNLGLLLTASVLPFPTAELAFAMGQGTYNDKVSALVLYAAISAAMAMSWLVVFIYLQRHPHLLRPGVPADFFRTERLRARRNRRAVRSGPHRAVVAADGPGGDGSHPGFLRRDRRRAEEPSPAGAWRQHWLVGRRLDVLEDWPVGVAGDEPGGVRRGIRALDDLAARGGQRRQMITV